GSWLTKYRNRYYLQNAVPDTACPWYSDAVWEADSINGPYKLADYSPASMKVGGFINSTGHSCLFQDRYGNWWRVTTMWIGVLGGFERRIGLFPAGFDARGRMFTRTELGDYPIVVPDGPVDANKTSLLAGWSVLSSGATATGSSILDDKHTPARATDENVRTWWSAKTGDAGEWFQLDLGAPMTVRAVQVNFAEQDTQQNPESDDYHAYRLLASEDGKSWQTLADKSANKTAVPHDYLPLVKPMKVRFVKVENVHSPKLGKFAIRDLRVFGEGNGSAPAPATDLQIKRLDPAYNVTFTWKPSANADGYVIRYGVAPDALHLNLQVQGGKNDKLTVSCLNADVKYFYRIDAYNKNGLTEGKVTSTAQ
ncbi:MAG TPA: discoidin domain-containing protein, partial [Chthoniobacterales bacterium]|nr:discoidin domain-containing protein [Chthoniobacterales bacterium]